DLAETVVHAGRRAARAAAARACDRGRRHQQDRDRQGARKGHAPSLQCAPMTTETLRAKLAEILDGGGGEAGVAVLVTLDSGARLGLDREARWVLLFDDGRP